MVRWWWCDTTQKEKRERSRRERERAPEKEQHHHERQWQWSAAADRRSKPRAGGRSLYPISFLFIRDFGTNLGVWFECCSGRLRSVSVRRFLVLSDESSGKNPSFHLLFLKN
ncbi:hypothetical protein Hanom_Chr16g01469691 [Helianthus anomalus]